MTQSSTPSRPARPFTKGDRVVATGIYSTGTVAGIVQAVRWDSRLGEYLVTVWFPASVGGDARLTAEYLRTV